MSPIAKRDSERRNRVTRTADKLYVRRDAPLEQPPCPDDWHPAVREWYHSLAESGQSELYEPSDWHTALAAGYLYDEWQETRRATTFGEYRMLCSQLMVTEGDRRRARFEIHRQSQDDSVPVGAQTVADYKARLRAVK